MDKTLTKEFLTNLLGFNVSKFKIEKNFIFIDGYTFILEAFVFKCKKWAAKQGFELTSSTFLLDGGECLVNFGYISEFEIGCDYETKKETEIEAIIDATMWVFNKLQLNTDITSYEYQKDYYYKMYNLTEFEFITQAMFTLGSGFEYDRVKGLFIDDKVELITNLNKAPNTKNQTVQNFRYLYPISISYLNKDWLEALKYVIEVFKRDRPQPIVYQGNSVDEALDKAIEYYELKISQLEH